MVSVCLLWIETNGLGVVGDGLWEFLLEGIGHRPPGESGGVGGVLFDVRGQNGNRPVVRFFFDRFDATVYVIGQRQRRKEREQDTGQHDAIHERSPLHRAGLEERKRTSVEFSRSACHQQFLRLTPAPTLSVNFASRGGRWVFKCAAGSHCEVSEVRLTFLPPHPGFAWRNKKVAHGPNSVMNHLSWPQE